MKRYYLFNAIYALPIFILLIIFKSQGYFMANIFREDLIYYALIIPIFTIIGVVGFGLQLFKIDWKDKKRLRFQIPALFTTVYILIVLACISQIYVTTGFGLILIIMAIPTISILISMLMTIKYRRRFIPRKKKAK